MARMRLSSVSIAVMVAVATALPVGAITRKEPVSLDRLQRVHRPFHRGRVVAPLQEVLDRTPNAAAWLAARAALGKDAAVMLDLRTGEPALVRGKPEPWIPGAGNRLSLADLSGTLGRSVTAVDAGLLRDLADRFVEGHETLLRVPRDELAFLEAVPVGRSLWVVTYEHRPGGVPVEGSRLTLVIGHGNLILWGSEKIAPLPATRSVPTVPRERAKEAVAALVGWDPGRDRWLGDGVLRLLLEARDVDLSRVPLGAGTDHRLVWELQFHRDGVTGTWFARVDALTGELLEFGDVNRYGGVRGGVEPKTWTDAEKRWPLPLVHLSTGGYTSPEGLFADPGSAVTGDLQGELTTIKDQCGTAGAPAVAADSSGDIDFGTGPANPAGDADCTTNGVGENGGEHNTHAARSAYYHITWIKEKGRKWLPANNWLASAHEVQVNIADVCNAYWSSSGFNGFFQEGVSSSGIHCFNTGEIAGVFLHEVGHGLDQNDAQGTADGGTGEAYSDTHAMLQLHDSCIGPGFWDRQCTGYGLPCVECSGVRDTDYAKHVDGNGDPVSDPFTPANFTGPHCPDGLFGSGPCGKEVHCESYPGTGAVWDLAVRKLGATMDEATAWYVTERDWYLGMQIATGMFNCNDSTFASDGCAATSWYQAMLAADDDDGDLTNGTPHASALYAAFADHAIACGTDQDAANQDHSACPALAVPTVNAAAGTDTITVSWDAVTNATEYVVLKNHGECAEGYVQAAVVAAPATSWTDTDVARYTAYSYRVIARTDNESCFSEASNCATATLVDCPASVESPPVLTAPADNRVDVAWDDSGNCSTFNVYRRQGGCADSGFVKIGSSAASPYTDNAVSGGVAYGYRITAVDPDGVLESGLSPCAEITATGVCNEEPAFAGATAAVNSHTGACGIDVLWNAGSTVCPGQAVVYNVYRDISSPFTPSAGNRIASGVTGTAYHDAAVQYGTTYYYIVRAEALSGAGSGPNGGREDGNTIVVSAAPSGPDSDLFADDVENGAGSWQTAAGPNDGGNTAQWEQVTDSSHSPDHAWFVSDEGSVKDQLLAMGQGVAIPAGAPAVLEFWHAYDTESGYDGGVLEYTTDGGSAWQDILDGDGNTVPSDSGRFLSGGYTRTLSTAYSNPLPGRQAWSGDSSGWVHVAVDVSAMAGTTVAFRWRIGCDSSASRDGWWLDDIRIYYGSACSGCTTAPDFAGLDTLTDHGTPQTALDLSWNAATVHCGSDAPRYRVYHGADTASVDFGTPVLETEATAIRIMGILPGQHCFAVRARDGMGNEDANTTILCATPASAQIGSGDADCGGSIDTADIPAIVAVIFGAADCGSGFSAADVDASGRVDAGDLGSEITYLHDAL